MNDIKNDTQMNVNADYVGPPKAHNFQNNSGNVATPANVGQTQAMQNRPAQVQSAPSSQIPQQQMPQAQTTPANAQMQTTGQVHPNQNIQSRPILTQQQSVQTRPVVQQQNVQSRPMVQQQNVQARPVATQQNPAVQNQPMAQQQVQTVQQKPVVQQTQNRPAVQQPQIAQQQVVSQSVQVSQTQQPVQTQQNLQNQVAQQQNPDQVQEVKEASEKETKEPAMQDGIQMPEIMPEDAQFNEEDLLAEPISDQKNDDADDIENHPERQSELLKMIARSDQEKSSKKAKEKKEKEKKKKVEKPKVDYVKEWHKFRKQVVIFLKKNRKTIQILNTIWGGAKFLMYCAGLSFFVFGAYFYFSFPSLVRSHLDKRGLSSVTFEEINYSVSELILKNVKDSSGLFSVKDVIVRYTFSDLLQKKIPSALINGLKINIKEEKNGKQTTRQFINILLKSGLLDNNMSYPIQSLQLENSSLSIGNKVYQLPVNFTGVGSFEKEKKLEFPIVLSNNYISLKATVLLDLSSGTSNWTMDIIEGNLTLPGFEKQTLKGKALLKTKNRKFASLNFEGSLINEGLDKKVRIQIDPTSGGEKYSLSATYKIPQDKTSVTEYALNMSNIQLAPDLRSFETNSPIIIDTKNIDFGKLKLPGAKITANGLLKCSKGSCAYEMQKRSNLEIRNPSFSAFDADFFVNVPLQLTIEPSKKTMFQFKNKKFDFNLTIKGVLLDLKKKMGSLAPLTTHISLNNLSLDGNIDFKRNTWKTDIKTSIEKIEDESFVINDATLEASLNSEDEGVDAKLKAASAQIKGVSYFKPAVKLDASMQKNDHFFVAEIETLDKQIAANLNGYYNISNNNISISVQTKKPIEFKRGYPLPQEISSLFSDQFRNVTGKMDVKGDIHYKSARSVTGPLKVRINSASFDYGNIKVKNLNTVMNLSNLVPFGAQGIQNIYAEKVLTTVPFDNVLSKTYFDASRKQFYLSDLTTKIAGYDISIDPLWYSYDAPIYDFTFRGKPQEVQTIIDQTSLKDLKIKGKGDIVLTTQLEGTNMVLKNAELSIPTDGSVSYTSTDHSDPLLEVLKNLAFRKLSVYLTEQDGKIDLIFSSDNKTNKPKKKTNFRMTITNPLEDYITPSEYPLPKIIQDEKDHF